MKYTGWRQKPQNDFNIQGYQDRVGAVDLEEVDVPGPVPQLGHLEGLAEPDAVLQRQRCSVSLVHPLFHTKYSADTKDILFYLTRALSEKGVRLAQKMQVGQCIPVGIRL